MVDNVYEELSDWQYDNLPDMSDEYVTPSFVSERCDDEGVKVSYKAVEEFDRLLGCVRELQEEYSKVMESNDDLLDVTHLNHGFEFPVFLNVNYVSELMDGVAIMTNGNRYIIGDEGVSRILDAFNARRQQ